MASADLRRADEALDWVRRIQDPHFADWHGHIAWLEASSDNARAFDEASFAIETATAGLAPAGPRPRDAVPDFANDNPALATPSRRRFAPAWGIGIAAALIAVVSLPSLIGGGTQLYMIRTAPGDPRTVTLAGGTQVALSGDSAVRLDRADPRTATVERGEVLFTVTHDAAHPFTVHAGDAVFQDVGTAFDVIRTKGRTDLAVREGAVLYDPYGAKVRLDRGQSIRLAGADASATLRRVDPASIGGWRDGRLSYADAPISEVAEDLARAIGQPVAVDRAAQGHSFSGVIVLDPDRALLARRVSAVTGLTMTPDGPGWRMVLPAR